ncbi:hypothetical protein PVAP13_1NG417219 [Panicum virgatum]|uniref:Uncharacterized protein n=1 Tax=Panicum virgatum TaxID=38727 RepID=A0A8T0WXA7_PANVG|nr:hypothetical protein PVAP13_1NG417219 [Panicum virgatum]
MAVNILILRDGPWNQSVVGLLEPCAPEAGDDPLDHFPGHGLDGSSKSKTDDGYHLSREVRHGRVRHDHEYRGRAVVVQRDLRLLSRELDVGLVDAGFTENAFQPAHKSFTVTGVRLRVVSHVLHGGPQSSVHSART